MRWLVALLWPASPVPLSIDSSNLEIIEAGIDAADRHAGPPMLNSASLERFEALDLAGRDRRRRSIITAAGASGMPSGAAERVEHAAADGRQRGGPLAIQHEPAVHRSARVPDLGRRRVRPSLPRRDPRDPRRWPAAHITGGMSNVSFGLPNRRLINDAFLVMAIEAGADSGILDPILNPPERALSPTAPAPPFQLASDVLTGADRNCKAFLRASRAGAFEVAA